MKVLGLMYAAFLVISFYVLQAGKYDIEKPGETPTLIGLILGFGFAVAFIMAKALLAKVPIQPPLHYLLNALVRKKRKDGKTWSL